MARSFPSGVEQRLELPLDGDVEIPPGVAARDRLADPAADQVSVGLDQQRAKRAQGQRLDLLLERLAAVHPP